MKSNPRSLTPPAFLVISATPQYTHYTGTKDQLISLGLALERHFPEARKRRSYIKGEDGMDSFRIQKIKGGRFDLLRWHGHVYPKKIIALLKFL